MNTTSSIPAAIDALVDRANTVKAAFAEMNVPVQVVDTSARSDGSLTQLVIAYAGGNASDAVTDTETISGLDVQRDHETYSLLGLVSTTDPDGNFKAARDLAYAVLDALHDAISADVTLGRKVIQARIAESPYVPKFGDKGATVSVPFRVAIQARRAVK